jgi:cytochrome c-type biogenesis protein CcmH
VSRYGEFVLLKPRFELHNFLLWGLPPIALAAGMIALFVTARRRQSVNVPAPALSAAEQQRIATLVEPRAD